MIDIHTHILPRMDDGSKSVEMSLEMLRLQKAQGVDTIVLTPHCYRNQEHLESFLSRREKSYKTLCNAVKQQQEDLPHLILGAEVAWVPNLPEWKELHEICIGNSSYMLVELPFHPWSDHMIGQLYNLMEQGITPVFAHLERYLDQKPEYIREIIGMGTPIQVSCEPLKHFWSRRPELQMLKRNEAHILASDCHNLTTRPPNLKDGFEAVQRLLGKEKAEILKRNAEQIVEGL